MVSQDKRALSQRKYGSEMKLSVRGAESCVPGAKSDLPTETTLQPTPILTLRQPLIHPPSEWPNWTKRPFFFVHFLLASRPSFSCLAIMADAPVDALLKGSSGKNTRGLLRIIILFTIAAAAVSSRLFSVIRMFLGTRILREMQLRVQLTELLMVSAYQVSRVSSMNVCVPIRLLPILRLESCTRNHTTASYVGKEFENANNVISVS